MTWLIWVFTGLMAAWIIAGLSAAGDNCDEHLQGSAERTGCEAGTVIGGGIGVSALFCVWFLGFVILSVIWFMTRPTRRICPVCGTAARKGQTTCKKCGFDFAGSQAPLAGH